MFQTSLNHQHSWQSVHQDAALPPLLSLLEALSRDYGQLIGRCVCAPRSGNVHISGSQERVESVTRAQFTQSDSADSNPVCFGQRGCSQWFGRDRSFRSPSLRPFQFPHSFFPLLASTRSLLWHFLSFLFPLTDD